MVILLNLGFEVGTAQVQSGPLELKIAVQGGITYTIHLNYEISGATITKSQEDPDPFNHHYYDRKIEGVVDSDQIRIRATGTIDQASETWMTWAAVVVNGKIMQESKLGKSGEDQLDVTIPVLNEKKYDIEIRLHIYPNSDYWVSVTGPLQFNPPVPAVPEGNVEKCGPCGGSDSGVRFSDLSGEVDLRPDCKENWWKTAEIKTIPCMDDHVRTGEDSSAILSFADMTTFVMKPETEIILDVAPQRDAKVKLVSGNIWENVKKMIREGQMEVEMSQGVMGIKGTTVVCEETGSSSTLKVLEGTAFFQSKATGEEIQVSAGEKATATENGLSQPQSFDVDAENASWEKIASKSQSPYADTGTSKVIFNNWNTGGVDNSPSCAPSFTLSEPHMITYIDTYHWNYGSGTKAGGTVVLRDHDGKEYGPWQVETKSGQGGVPNAWWIAHPNEVIPAGTYGVVDSEQSTWSQNPESEGCGFSKVEGYPVKDMSKQQQQPAEVTGESKTTSSNDQEGVGVSSLVATDDNPQDAKGWYAKGYNLARQGEYDEAIKAYDEAIRLDPKYVNAWYAKGNNLNNLGRYHEAIEAYDETIRLDTKYENAWYAKGVVLRKQGKYDEAIEAYDEAIRLNPQDANAWYAKGYALKLLGRTTEADAAFAKAKELGYTG